MLKQIRLLIGISIFWLALSIVQDGVNTLVLPLRISQLASHATQATTLGLLTMIGLLAAALIQPIAGALADRWRPRLGRKGFIGIGLLLCLLSLFFFAVVRDLTGIMVGYLLVQLSASLAQAGQQGLIPDLMDKHHHGIASGLKGFMDIAGAMLGFVLLGQLLGSNQTTLALGIIAAVLITSYLLAVLLTPEDRPDRAAISSESISASGLFRLDLTHQSAFKSLLLSRFLFLFGIYAIGRFLLFFVSARLGVDSIQAAQQAGNILAGLAFVTILASPLTGWLADRIGRVPLMVTGAIFGAVSALLLILAKNSGQILLFGSLMSLGSAAFAGGSWALLADLVPKDQSARYFGLANFSTAGSMAAAGLLGPVIDWVDRVSPGNGYSLLFIVSSIAFIASIVPIRRDVKTIGVQDGDKRKVRTYASGLAVLSLPADPAISEEDQDSP